MGIKRHLKGLSIFLLSCMVTMQISEIEVFSKSINTIEGIIANTTVKDLGETVENFEITVKENIDLSNIKAEDFVIENAIVDHFGNIGEIDVTDLIVEENKITLDVEDFLTIKSNGSMGDELKVTCTSNEELSFTYSDITKIVSPVADKFETKEYNGLTYKLFSPETEEALPIVIWMHGRGDNGLQLRSARNATMFAEDENQAENPCYVFAPQSDESVTAVKWTDNELENIISVIEQLIEEGKVDPNRVYLTGHSMGGQGAWNLLRKAPDMFAAAITMAPRIISEQQELDDLEALKDLPVWFFHATNDPINLVSGSKDRYNKLLEVGNKNLRYTELSDEEMIEFGAGANTHATNIVMANTPGVMEWLFAQNKNNENQILNITVNATVKDLGETVENFEVTVEDDVDLSNIKAEDFVIENAIVDHFGNVGDIDVTDLIVEGNKITLDVEDFLTIKSNGSMGDELKVTCTSNEALSFTYSDITKIVSPVADKFETKEYNGLTYKLFSPETDKALPIVIWMHGRGDNGLQLRSARNATMFAEDENQAENPCYVFAPQSDESVTAVKWTDNELQNIISVIEQLIEEGKVDPNRVYLTGHSMGGQGVWNLLRKAPDMFAAAITMAPRIISEQQELDDLEALKDLPVWFFHATNDPINLVSGSKDRYNKLLEVGNKNLRYTELSDEEMIEFGAGANTHATNIVMANTPGVMEWLFAKTKEVVVDEDNNGTEKPPVNVEDGDDNKDEDSSNKPESLPNTGAPISSMMIVICAVIAIIFGKKIIALNK